MTELEDRGPPGPVRSLYVHVPFCLDRCTYCAFVTTADDPARHRAFVDAILAESTSHSTEAPLETVYIGGGTPSRVPAALLSELLDGLRGQFGLEPGAEVTLEANPTDISQDALEAWRGIGVTRVSLGVQTFAHDVLARLGRHHDGNGAAEALRLLQRHGPETWSADLLVGWAGQARDDLVADVWSLLEHEPPHVSIYPLTIESDTPLAAQQMLGVRVTSPSDAYDGVWSEMLVDAGYERYEIANFARPGHRSRHNQVYWANGGYIGLGPGACSSVHPLRWRNRTSVDQYLDAVLAARTPRDTVERVSPFQRLLESLAVGLRTSDGLPVPELDRRFGSSWREPVLRPDGPLVIAGGLAISGDRLKLRDNCRTLTDRLMSEWATGAGPDGAL